MFYKTNPNNSNIHIIVNWLQEFNIGTIGVATMIIDEIYDSTTIKSFFKFCKVGG
jgi:hypothetical protein